MIFWHGRLGCEACQKSLFMLREVALDPQRSLAEQLPAILDTLNANLRVIGEALNRGSDDARNLSKQLASVRAGGVNLTFPIANHIQPAAVDLHIPKREEITDVEHDAKGRIVRMTRTEKEQA
jgi:hypothetical protein